MSRVFIHMFMILIWLVGIVHPVDDGLLRLARAACGAYGGRCYWGGHGQGHAERASDDRRVSLYVPRFACRINGVCGRLAWSLRCSRMRTRACDMQRASVCKYPPPFHRWFFSDSLLQWPAMHGPRRDHPTALPSAAVRCAHPRSGGPRASVCSTFIPFPNRNAHILCSVHAHAASALINFCEGVERDTLLPYLDPIVERLLKLLNPQASPTQVRRYVQEQAITTLAMVADASETTFVKVRPPVVAQEGRLMLMRGAALWDDHATAAECPTECGRCGLPKAAREGDGVCGAHRYAIFSGSEQRV